MNAAVVLGKVIVQASDQLARAGSDSKFFCAWGWAADKALTSNRAHTVTVSQLVDAVSHLRSQIVH